MFSRRVLFINLIAVIIILVIAEVVSRRVIADIYKRDFDKSLIKEDVYKTSDCLYPDKQGQVWGKLFTTDNFGGRKNRKPFDKKKKTWLFIGDSVTQGVGVEDSSTFVSLVGDEIDSVNVLNISMIGWSMADYANVVDYIMNDSTNAMNIQHITICYCLNDVYGNTKTSELPVMGGGGVFSKLNGFLQEKYYTYKLLKLWVFRNSNNYLAYDKARHSLKEPYLLEALKIMANMYYVTGFKHYDFDAIILPYRGMLIEDKHTEIPGMPYALANNMVFEFSMRGVKSKNPGPYMFRKGPEKKSDYYLYADEIHLSPLGHRAVADVLLGKAQ